MLIKYGVSQLKQSLLLVVFIYIGSPFSANQSFLAALNHWLLRTFKFHAQCSPTSFDAFTDEFTSFIVPFLEISLCMIAGDFNRCDTAFLSLLNLSNIVNFPIRNNAFLDKFFVNSLKHFNVYLRAPLGSSDHCILKLLPKIYGHLGRIASDKRSTC